MCDKLYLSMDFFLKQLSMAATAWVILFLPTFLKSNAWDFHLQINQISEDFPMSSDDYWKFSNDFRRFPTVSKYSQTPWQVCRELKIYEWQCRINSLIFWSIFCPNWILNFHLINNWFMSNKLTFFSYAWEFGLYEWDWYNFWICRHETHA